MKTLCFLFAILCQLLFSVASSEADVILTVEVDPPVDAGTVATVSFFARSNVSGQQLTGVNLPVDIGPGGTALPPELSFLPGDLSVVNEIGGVTGGLNTAAATLSLNNTDAVVNVVGFSPVTLTSTDTLLFDLLLNVDPSATPGIFPVSINSGGDIFDGLNFNVLNGSGVEIPSEGLTISNGSVEIAGVPEPNSIVLLFGGLGMACLKRRRN